VTKTVPIGLVGIPRKPQRQFQNGSRRSYPAKRTLKKLMEGGFLERGLSVR
jgi:hypothetical protein